MAKGVHTRRRRWLVIVAVVASGVAVDAMRAPERQWSARLAIGGVHLYQRTVSPALARLGATCRFTPTCSHYAEAVLRQHGIIRGSWLTARRVAHCGPWTAAGTRDAPP
ncbi:MAG: membrane protein insertion efficiency factor YidD [Bacteroidales bacterium]